MDGHQNPDRPWDVSSDPATRRIVASGEIDIDSVPALDAAWASMASTGATIVDFSAVTFFSAAGVGRLVRWLGPADVRRGVRGGAGDDVCVDDLAGGGGGGGAGGEVVGVDDVGGGGHVIASPAVERLLALCGLGNHSRPQRPADCADPGRISPLGRPWARAAT